MASFAGVSFKVGAVGPGIFPHISRESPVWRYRCRARIDSTANWRALLDKLTALTPEPILGTHDAFIQIEAGPAAASLIVPDESGASITFAAAYLTGISGRTDGRVADRYIAELEFAIRGEVTP